MRQYDVFQNPTPRTRTLLPYLLVLQSDLVSATEAVIVAPLSKAVHPEGSRLYPKFTVANESYILLTPDLASMPRTALTEHVTNLAEDHHCGDRHSLYWHLKRVTEQ